MKNTLSKFIVTGLALIGSLNAFAAPPLLLMDQDPGDQARTAAETRYLNNFRAILSGQDTVENRLVQQAYENMKQELRDQIVRNKKLNENNKFLSLPSEIIIEIRNYLDPISKISLGYSCNTMHNTMFPKLTLAVNANDVALVKTLIAAGADVCQTDSFGTDAFHYAEFAQNYKMMKILLNSGQISKMYVQDEIDYLTSFLKFFGEREHMQQGNEKMQKTLEFLKKWLASKSE